MKTILAILTLMLVLVGPASAQDADPPQQDPAPDGADPPAGEASQTQSAQTGSSDGSTADGQTAACRLVATHIADPRMSPSRWVITDPDGCIRRTIERLISPTALAGRFP